MLIRDNTIKSRSYWTAEKCETASLSVASLAIDGSLPRKRIGAEHVQTLRRHLSTVNGSMDAESKEHGLHGETAGSWDRYGRTMNNG